MNGKREALLFPLLPSEKQVCEIVISNENGIEVSLYEGICIMLLTSNFSRGKW
jgi:hypothetical protein